MAIIVCVVIISLLMNSHRRVMLILYRAGKIQPVRGHACKVVILTQFL